MRAYLIGSVSLVVGFVAVGCSGDDCTSSGTCITPDAGDASVADSSDLDVPKGCDLGGDVSTNAACVDDGIGVFVDATNGNDTNPGTKASPFKTIGKGIGAAGAKPRVYVCAGTYVEDVSLTQTNAVSLYGGLKCVDWTFDGSIPIVGKTSLSLHVDGVIKPIVISDFSFVANAGTSPGDSAVAAFVNASTDVTLRRVKLRPGAGKDGKAGTTGANWTQVAQTDASIKGNDAAGATGGKDHTCSLCADSANSTGGGGGTGANLTSTGGTDGKPSLSGQSPLDGKGGAATCTAGDNGASAGAGTSAPGATIVGKLTSAGWVPGDGQSGPNGGPGQGGGGGGGGTNLTSPGGGGGGGCGGCGGAGGKGGGGGGASIGIAVVGSKVTLVACDIVTLAGGAGGAGSNGQDGQLGGYAGSAVSPGCAGGVGGSGGKGGAGGGGAGGISVGVVYTDTKPVYDQSTTITVPTAPALKGGGGATGVDDGIDGVAQATLQASSS